MIDIDKVIALIEGDQLALYKKIIPELSADMREASEFLAEATNSKKIIEFLKSQESK